MHKLFLLPFVVSLVLPLMAQLPPPELPPAPLIFDKSLQELEREGTITIKESQQLQRGEYNPPQRVVPNLSNLCSSGVLSKRECAKANGVAFVERGQLKQEGLVLPLTFLVDS